MNIAAPELTGRYPRINGVRLSMVANSNLQTSGVSQSSSDVSNTLDRELLKHLRSIADIAVTDVATALVEGYRPSKLVEIEIWTKSGNSRGLEDRPASQFKQFRVTKVDGAVERLQAIKQSHSSILLETGPTVSNLLAGAHMVDEACLTVTQALDQPSAMSSLESFAVRIGLDYLKTIETVWLEDTLFARLGR